MVTAWNYHIGVASRLGGRVLDAGCGNGDYTLFLAAQGCDVTSLDIQPIDSSHHGVRYCDNVPGGRYVQGDVQALPFSDGSFDGVLCWDMLQNVKDAPLALREFRRVLLPGGLCSVRTTIRRTIPWVKPGETAECGSSGVSFICWTVWNPDELIAHAERAGFRPLVMTVDPWNHQCYLGEAI